MNESQIFADALKLATPAERAAFLEGVCAENPQLRADVEALLVAHATDPGFLEQPAGSLAGTVEGPGQPRPEPQEPHQPGDVLAGRYKLVEEIGEGGMGSVWMAQQTEPVKRLVAVKLIKAGMDSKQVIARFEAERQALALMDHTNIARVLDAGTTSAGRPYFVMDLVKGIVITRYCDEHHLTPRQRLELFLPVCAAVQHAHQKGIIHRDIKPSNVLVALYDGRPVPKVIDFGIAKAAGQQLTDKTLVTGFGAIVGTLEYMSPEQAEINQLDVDTRSDIYSLGVLLYELLTGTTPLEHKQVKEAGLLEVLRIIREEETSRPSTRLSTAEELPTIAANRGTEPKKLSALFRGEVDWIVMKCMEKDRGRRYETATGLAADVRRFLADEPVLACPPAVGYRVRKFVRRNRGPVVAAALVVLALVVGIVGTTAGLVWAERARETAQKRLDQVERGIELIASVFENLDPNAEEKEGRPLRAILGERLDTAATELEGEAVGDPLVVARLQDRLGRTYLGLGQAAKAEALFARAVAACRDRLGPDHKTTLGCMNNLAEAYRAGGKPREAIKLFRQVREAREEMLGADDPETLTTLHRLAVAYMQTGKAPEAVALLEQVREAFEKRFGADDPRTLATLANLASAYMLVRRHVEGIALSEKVLAARQKKHGETHPLALESLNNLARAYSSGLRMKDAIDLYEKAQTAVLPKLGDYHPLTLSTLQSLAYMYRAYGRTRAAINLAEKVRERRMLILGAHHPATLATLNTLAWAYWDAGKLETALPLFQEAAIGFEKLGYEHGGIDAGQAIRNLCRCYEVQEQYDKAEAWRRKWLAAVRAKDEPGSPQYAEALRGLGWNLLQQNKHAEAEPFLRECLPMFQKNEPKAWETVQTESALGAALLGQKKYADAEPYLRRGCEGMHQWADRLGPSHAAFTTKPVTNTLERLVWLYEALGKPAEAAKWRKELEARGETEATPKPPDW